MCADSLTVQVFRNRGKLLQRRLQIIADPLGDDFRAGRFADSSNASSFSPKRSRVTFSRLVNSSQVNDLKRSVSTRLWRLEVAEPSRLCFFF
jgi:hypothetical protein